MTPDLIFHRSTRRPRLYVRDRHGRQVGWLDLSTGRRTVTDAAFAKDVDIALQEFQRLTAGGVPAAKVGAALHRGLR